MYFTRSTPPHILIELVLQLVVISVNVRRLVCSVPSQGTCIELCSEPRSLLMLRPANWWPFIIMLARRSQTTYPAFSSYIVYKRGPVQEAGGNKPSPCSRQIWRLVISI